MKRIVISIFGGSGGGKSTLAKAVVACLGRELAVRIPTDYFLAPNPFDSLELFFRRPLQYDWALVEAFLQAENDVTLTTPDYDFDRFARLSDTGGRSVTMRPIAVLDGMCPYPKADLLIHLSLPAAERKKRIRARDRIWGTRVIAKWNLHQGTMKDVFRLQYPIDLQLVGFESAGTNAEKIVALLKERGLLVEPHPLK